MNEKQEARRSRSQKSLWPLWFPYPSSWLRSFALALWMAIVLWIAGFWGVLFGIALANILKRPETLLWFLGLALLVAVLVFSYTHYFLWGNSYLAPGKMDVKTTTTCNWNQALNMK